MKKIQGLYPATATPYKKDGSINMEAIEMLMRRNIEEGASGFFVGGSSAECFLLTESERISIFEAACAFKNDAVIVAHVGAISTDESIRYAKAAKSFGAQYISATLPFYYGFNSAQTAGYFYDIAEAADMQIMVYNFPVFTGKSIDLKNPDVRGLLCSDIVCGIKHTDLNLALLERIRDLNPDLAIMVGYDEIITAGLAMGADGSIGSMFNVMLPHFMKIYNACRTGDFDTAQALQIKANNVVEAFVNAGLIASIKYMLTEQGIEAGPPRKPFTQPTAEQMEHVLEVFSKNIEK